MSVRGVFFDLYGTLLVYGDMRTAWDAWLTTLHVGLRRHGLALSRDAFATCCDGFFGRVEPADPGDGSTVLERRLGALCNELALDVRSAALREIGEAAAEVWQGHITLDPEAAPVIGALRGRYALALVSNFDHAPHVRRVLGRCGWGDAFNAIIVSAEAGAKKPDPRIFEIALERTGLSPDEVVHVGDADEDIQGARAAGIRPILIRRPAASDSSTAFDFHAGDGRRDKTPSAEPGIAVIAGLADLLTLLAA